MEWEVVVRLFTHIHHYCVGGVDVYYCLVYLLVLVLVVIFIISLG